MDRQLFHFKQIMRIKNKLSCSFVTGSSPSKLETVSRRVGVVCTVYRIDLLYCMRVHNLYITPIPTYKQSSAAAVHIPRQPLYGTIYRLYLSIFQSTVCHRQTHAVCSYIIRLYTGELSASLVCCPSGCNCCMCVYCASLHLIMRGGLVS